MAYRVEMFGPMCAGKSTIFKRLIGCKDILICKRRILSQDQIEKLELLDYAKSNNYLKYLLFRVLFLSGALEHKVVHSHINAVAWQCINLYQELPPIEHIWKISVCNRCYASANVELELKRMLWFIKAIASCALLEKSDKAIVALQDESFIQRGISFSFHDESYLNNVESYYNEIPLPRLAVYVTASEDALVSRAIKRNGCQSQEIKNLKKAIRLSELVENILRNQGCDIFTIDTTNGVQHSVNALAKKIVHISRLRPIESDNVYSQ